MAMRRTPRWSSASSIAVPINTTGTPAASATRDCVARASSPCTSENGMPNCATRSAPAPARSRAASCMAGRASAMRSRLKPAMVRPRLRAGMNAPATLVPSGATRRKSSGASFQNVGGARNPTFVMDVRALGPCRCAPYGSCLPQPCQAKPLRDVRLQTARYVQQPGAMHQSPVERPRHRVRAFGDPGCGLSRVGTPRTGGG